MNDRIRAANRLIGEKSPYLLQHAHNPVDWLPWGEEAFEKARTEDKPVFLSIGYSACHWCHVMERESFEDELVADVLNRAYVPVKVDREERPDVDHVYMTACQALTGQGGWPLTIVTTPDRKPFFAATYLPRKARFGLPGLLEVLERIARAWRQDRSRLVEAGNSVAEALQGLSTARPGALNAAVLDDAYRGFLARFDEEYGGFGPPPKFPSPHSLVFLIRHWRSTGEEAALQMAVKTLDAMRRGGIFDQIGFGFSRYSTDRQWLVPHFEKMLYDNALLAYAYLEAYQATREPRHAEVAREIFSYVKREMRAPEGAYHSAQDADSEGVEGKFYLWTEEEVKETLGEDDGSWFCETFGITKQGNFKGKNIPNVISGATLPEVSPRLQRCRHALLKRRSKRVPPFKDDKILTSWNALMIAALAKGAKALLDESLAKDAVAAADFLLSVLRREDGRLLCRYRDAEAEIPGYLDDYSFLGWALLELYNATYESRFLLAALELTRQVLELFWDDEGGGFFFTGVDAESLIARPKESRDGAIPSGNSAAALNLSRLARLTGDGFLREKADAQLAAFAGEVSSDPCGHAFFLTALQFELARPITIAVVGERGDADTEAMLRHASSSYAPGLQIVFRPAKGDSELEKAIPYLREMKPLAGRAAAYICEGYSCRPPITDPGALARELEGSKPGSGTGQQP